jgi:hypothetical protein
MSNRGFPPLGRVRAFRFISPGPSWMTMSTPLDGLPRQKNTGSWRQPPAALKLCPSHLSPRRGARRCAESTTRLDRPTDLPVDHEPPASTQEVVFFALMPPKVEFVPPPPRRDASAPLRPIDRLGTLERPVVRLRPAELVVSPLPLPEEARAPLWPNRRLISFERNIDRPRALLAVWLHLFCRPLSQSGGRKPRKPR